MVCICKGVCRLNLGGQKKKPAFLFKTHNRCRPCGTWYPKENCPIRCGCCGQTISMLPRDNQNKKPYRLAKRKEHLTVRQEIAI